MPRPTVIHAKKRSHVENAQALLDGLQDGIDECILRNRQAIRRSSAVIDVLDPAILRLAAIREKLEQAHQELNQLWQDEQNARLERLREQK